MMENLEQVRLIPSSLEAFGLNTAFERGFLREQIEGHMAQDGEVLGRVTLAHARIIFAEGDIEYPVELVFDGPVGA
jgi:hypothetical protein